jgi:hypothetical protein
MQGGTSRRILLLHYAAECKLGINKIGVDSAFVREELVDQLIIPHEEVSAHHACPLLRRGERHGS